MFFSGDSGYFAGFKEIGERFGPFDLTFLESGAYNENWLDVHMLPEQTVQAHLDLRGKVLQPIHWGKFDLALHDWAEPIERLSAAAAENGVHLTTPAIGQVYVLLDPLPKTAWWRAVPETSTAENRPRGGRRQSHLQNGRRFPQAAESAAGESLGLSENGS